MKTVRIDYTIREGVDLDDVTRRITALIAEIGKHDPSHRYASYQHVGEPRRFTHVGMFGDRLDDLQAQPFFGEWAAFLRAHCEVGPTVTPLARVASTP